MVKIDKGYQTGVYRNWIQYRVSEPALRGLTYLGIVGRFLLQRAQSRGQTNVKVDRHECGSWVQRGRWFTTNTNFIRRNGCRHVWIEIQNSFSFSQCVLTQDTDKNANANSDRDRESKCNIRLSFSLRRPTSDCILDLFLKLKQQRQCEKKQW